MNKYTSDYYKSISNNALSSAEVIVPLVLKCFQPESIIDVGCGLGAWLFVFMKYGIKDIFGIDGDWVNRNELLIPNECFKSFDLNKPIRINKSFDLVVSLEVAEHLPGENADKFVNSLTSLGNIILFSAAIPYQGGEHHVNEQWPEYWEEKFKNKGYIVIDCFRNKIWNNERVAQWYAQNLLLYVKSYELRNNEKLMFEYNHTNEAMLSLIHPKFYLDKITESKFDYHQRKKTMSIKERIKYVKLYQGISYGFQTMEQAMFRPFKRRWRNRNVSQNLKIIRNSVYFDDNFYLANYPDVLEAKINPVLHYLHYGGFEGRNPGPNFDSSWYLNRYRDVRLAEINPLIHYLKYGLSEGRSIHPNLNNADTPKINSKETMKDGVSIVICCHNSELLLPSALKYLLKIKILDAIPIEVIIIDNASEDETSKVAKELWPEESPIPLRIIFEPNLGLSYARQRGLQEASYEFVSFIDDDNWLAANWIETVYRVMKDHPEVGICGGMNKYETESTPPRWFNKFKHAYAVGKQGSQSGDVTERKFVYGAGLTLRKSVWQKIVAKGFRPLLIDRQGTALSAGGDSELCHVFILEGWKLWYEENLILTHYLPEQRLNWNYLRKMHRGFGASDTILGAYQQVMNGETLNKLAPGESFWLNRVNFIIEDLKDLEEKVFVYQLDTMEGDGDVLVIDYLLGYLFEMYRIKDRYDEIVYNIHNLLN